MPSAPDPSDLNPYAASHSPGQSAPKPRAQPGPLAIVGAILLGGVAACLGFFCTCVGMLLVGVMNLGDGGVILLLIASGLTAVGAFVFTVWGLLKVREAAKN